MVKKERVLIVEDEPLVREMIQGILGELEYEVVGKATGGQEAVTMTETLQPDVVLMDIKMPDMDGIEATRRIYQHCPAPVVVLTAYETPELVKRASEVGIGAYVVKPPKAQEVERAITIATARFDDMMALRLLNGKLQLRNKALEEALGQVKTLSGLLPICASCKKIRDDEGYWQQVEIYIRNRSNADFTHGLCPDCKETLYADLESKRRSGR